MIYSRTVEDFIYLGVITDNDGICLDNHRCLESYLLGAFYFDSSQVFQSSESDDFSPGDLVQFSLAVDDSEGCYQAVEISPLRDFPSLYCFLVNLLFLYYQREQTNDENIGKIINSILKKFASHSGKGSSLYSINESEATHIDELFTAFYQTGSSYILNSFEIIPEHSSITLDFSLAKIFMLIARNNEYLLDVIEDIVLHVLKLEDLIKLKKEGFFAAIPYFAAKNFLFESWGIKLRAGGLDSSHAPIDDSIPSYITVSHLLDELTEDDYIRFLTDIFHTMADPAPGNVDIVSYLAGHASFRGAHLGEMVLKMADRSLNETEKLRLWLRDTTPKLKLDSYCTLFDEVFDPKIRPLVIKKLFHAKKLGAVSFDITDLRKIKTEDFRTRLMLAVIDLILRKQSWKDFVNLPILKELHGSEYNEIDMTVYFAPCNHRTKEDGKQGEDMHRLCDGRIAENKTTGKRTLSERNHKPYWWCANYPCFNAVLAWGHQDNWERYTVWNILKILGYEVNERDYGYKVGYLNKLKRYLPHLKCRSCSRFMAPVKESNYASDRINFFHCVNPECPECQKDTPVYLTHCLNGACEGIIDCRDNLMKCPGAQADNNESNLGMYICKDCNACCSTDMIKNRIFIMNSTGQEYRGRLEGHKDLGKLFCDQCKSEMQVISDRDIKIYQAKVISWLEAPNQRHYVIEQGFIHSKYTNEHKKSFRVDPGIFRANDMNKILIRWAKHGLIVETSESSISISEPFDSNTKVKCAFICSNDQCHNVKAYWSQSAHYQEMIKYHKEAMKKAGVIMPSEWSN